MARWRQLLGRLGQFADRVRVRPDAARGTNGALPTDSVEPSEIALILLKNAMRLLDQSMAPGEIGDQVSIAIRELEKFVSQRPR